MRIVILTVAFWSMSLGLPGAEFSGGDNSPIKVTQTMKDGTLRISMKNVSRKPILAYVIGVEGGEQSNTHHDFFTGRNSFGPGKTIELVFALKAPSSTPRVYVDYVRLADNSTWGSQVTEDARDVAASFQR